MDGPSEAGAAFDRVDPGILHGFWDLVAELGGSPNRLLDQAGIDVESFERGSWCGSYLDMIALVVTAGRALDCLDFGMRLARLQAGALDTPLSRMVKASTTLGEALDEVVRRSYAHSLAASIWMKVEPDHDCVRIGHDILVDGQPDKRQAIEQILLVEYLTCLEATAGAARARWIEFRHERVSEASRYRSYFGCEVRFGQSADAIVYGRQALACPIVSADPDARRRTIADIDVAFPRRRPPLSASLRGVVMHLLARRLCTNENAAAALGLSARSLLRQLRGERTSFQRIKDQVRRDMMVYYLDHTQLPIREVSERLGFSEQSAMNRFCRQALLSSPTKRRAQLR